jgi:hypothetical protein
MRRKVLLLSFRYPPYNRVGAYRWTKLARKLAELGHVMQVCTVRWPAMGQSAWLADAVHPNIHVHRVHSGYVQRFKYRPPSGQVTALCHKLLLRLEQRLGLEDEAQFWSAFLRPFVRRLMQSDPSELLIATGPPFSVNHVAAQIKMDFPALKLVHDFRDPWIPASQREALRSRRTLEAADLVVAVTPEMADSFARNGARNVACVSNGFERELIASVARSGEPLYDFVHIGSIFNERSAPLARFLSWVRARSKAGLPVRVALIGRFPQSVRTDFADLVAGGLLTLEDHLPQERALSCVAASRFALQLNAPEASTQVSTKIFEYGALRVPTVSINYGGAIDTLVKRHGLGVSVPATAVDFEQQLDACLRLSSSDFGFDVEPFSFARLAKQYSELLAGL